MGAQDREGDIETRAEALLGEITLEEKVSLLAGEDMWHTRRVARLGVPSFRMTDGPHGVTVSGELSGPATCFPTGVGMAATWDMDLIREVGSALGRETRAKGNQVLLGPAADLHRSPLNGRNYESYSEDPFLAARLTVACVQGVQREGVGACIKHCTANNQQTAQSRTSSEVDERALREIYLPPWEAAVREAGPWAIMTSYNLLNGEYTSANRHLLTEIIKGEWGFRGFIVSDWRGVHSVDAANAGLDLEMPGPGKYMTQETLLPAVQRGEVSEAVIDDKVRRLLATVVRTGLMGGRELPDGELDTPRHRTLARRVAEEGIVLLKNAGGVLPFKRDGIGTIAVIGPNAAEARLGGGGSSSTTPFYAVSPLEGLKRKCGDDVRIVYVEGCSFKGNLPVVQAEYLSPAGDVGNAQGLTGEYFANPDLEGAPAMARADVQVDFSWGWRSPGGAAPKGGYSARWTGRLTAPETGRYRLGMTWEDGGVRLYLDGEALIDEWGRPEGENFEALYAVRSRSVAVDLEAGQARGLRIEYRKTGNKASVRFEWEAPGRGDAVRQAAEAAARSDAAVVFAGLSNLYEGGNNDKVDIDLPGAQTELIEAVAAANPNTVVVLINGSPVRMDPWIEKAPAVLEAWYPGQEGGNAIANVLFGDVNPSGKLPETFPRRLEDNPSYGNFPGEGGKVHYAEGIFVGYRHYDRKQIAPLFPFGYGLSYTRFEYRNLQVLPEGIGIGDGFEVSVAVRNAGERAGKEVVQLYVGDLASSVERPVRELKAFEKVDLEAGEVRTVRFALDERALAFYDLERKAWVVEPGDFEIVVGGHSRSGVKALLHVV